ncbi:DUF262 domain-containing protein [Methanobacterium subterraneum]|uniref:DUF262 domain-containing protein n=1 Tax=Methanobacterium subterraneum TaxID=59277 RepID=A0A7K4DM80_9EURY|nr:DUF262 domain-containing protein [Methanobacterium subterraneum]NMO09490.1 DUF262 domain-containing protein [Methanobacterium subterraneum]
MKAGEERFMDLMRKDVQFKVPIYQRLYDWKTSHCQTLIDDILQLLRNPEIPIHFMGSIVYIDEKGQGLVGSTREILLIDGQQRITTFTLIFIILEEFANKEGNSLAEEIRNRCLINQYSKLENKNKLILTRNDNKILELLLRGQTYENNHSNIIENFEYLKNQFEKILEEFSVNEVYDNLDRIMVVDVGLLHGQDNPQQIFESLNATGKALTDADLIRNFLLMNLDSEFQNKIYLDYWHPMEQLLGDGLTDFLEFFAYMKKSVSTNIKDLYKDFKILFYKEVSIEENWASDVERFAEQLLRYSKHYNTILSANDEFDEVKNALNDLNRLDYYSHVPLLLRVFNEYKKGDLSSKEVCDIIKVIESFLFRRSICNIPTNSLNPIFRTLWKKLKDSEESLDEFIIEPTLTKKIIFELKLGERNKRWPDDDEFKEKLIYNDLYRHRFDKLLFAELEKNSSKEAKKDFAEFSVEHILPQTSGDPEKLSDDWKQMLGPDYIEIRNKWLHKMGNLTLTGYNPELSDNSFDFKKEMPNGFKESPLKLNLDIAKYDVWNERSILERSHKLALMAIDRWGFFDE